MSYTFQVDGVEIKSPMIRPSESALHAALALAAAISFQEARPITLSLNGQPYRRVSVEFVDSLTKRR